MPAKYSLKLIFFYLFTLFMYLATPVCMFAVINIGVSLKYEVDEALIFVEMNQKLSSEEKMLKRNEIREQGVHLQLEQSLWMLSTIVFPVGATLLLLYKKKIVGFNTLIKK